MHDQTRRQTLLALAAGVFDEPLALGCAEITSASVDALLGSEADAMRAAVESRKREFAAGRIAARAAMGIAVPIPMGADRAPIWPPGVAGSITHAGGWALAATTRAGRLIGLDLELAEPLPAEVLGTVLSPSEHDWTRKQANPGLWARVIFSVKECAYKAQYARSRQIFGFEMFETRLDPGEARFTAVFQGDVAPFTAGETLTGRFSVDGGFILAGILR